MCATWTHDLRSLGFGSAACCSACNQSSVTSTGRTTSIAPWCVMANARSAWSNQCLLDRNLLRSFEADSGVKCSEGSQTTSSSTDRTRCSAPTVCLSSSMARKVNRENGRMGQLKPKPVLCLLLRSRTSVPEVPARAPKLSVTRICGILQYSTTRVGKRRWDFLYKLETT